MRVERGGGGRGCRWCGWVCGCAWTDGGGRCDILLYVHTVQDTVVRVCMTEWSWQGEKAGAGYYNRRSARSTGRGCTVHATVIGTRIDRVAACSSTPLYSTALQHSALYMVGNRLRYEPRLADCLNHVTWRRLSRVELSVWRRLDAEPVWLREGEYE